MTDGIKIKKDFIEKYMKSNKISLNNLAKQIGISSATLSRLLTGTRNPGQVVIGRMLSFFCVDFEQIFYYDPALTKVNNSENSCTK